MSGPPSPRSSDPPTPQRGTGGGRDRPPWHPLLALSEADPGPPRKYGDIRLVRHDKRLAYRCLVMPPRSERPVDLGLAPTLRAAAELVHLRFVGGHSRRDHQGYPA